MTIRETIGAVALTAAILAAIAGHAHAGGPIIEDTAEAAPAPKLSPGEKIGLAVLLLIGVAALASGGGDDTTEPPKGCLNDGGC